MTVRPSIPKRTHEFTFLPCALLTAATVHLAEPEAPLFEPCAAWTGPSSGRVLNARAATQLILASESISYAQIIGSLGSYHRTNARRDLPSSALNLTKLCSYT